MLVPRVLYEFRVRSQLNVRNRHQHAIRLRERGCTLVCPWSDNVLVHADQILPPLAFVRELEKTFLEDSVADLLLRQRSCQRFWRREYAGALLAPTDPVLTSSIVTNPRVPRLVRHSLNLESGLNDGLALPAVLAFAAALSADSHNFVWWRFVLQDVGLGFLYGMACGWIASLLMPRAKRRGEAGRPADERIPAHQRSLFALGVAFATYGVTVLSPKGNGFIAVFVAAIVLSVRRPDVREHFERNSEEIVEIVKLGIFLVFGSLLSVHAFTSEGWVALAFVAVTFLLARPLAVWIALMGTRTDAATRLFMGWFGPKGVASMTFALIVLDRQIPGGVRIFNLTALVVFCSIILHGITDTPGAKWIARHAERTGIETDVEERAGGEGGASAQA